MKEEITANDFNLPYIDASNKPCSLLNYSMERQYDRFFGVPDPDPSYTFSRQIDYIIDYCCLSCGGKYHFKGTAVMKRLESTICISCGNVINLSY